MVRNHLKRYKAPTSWALLTKEQKFTTRAKPGAHPRKLGMPLNIMLKKQKLAETTKEIKKVLNIKNILIDGTRKKDHRLPVGLMDTIEIQETGEAYRIGLDTKGRLTINEISKEEAKQKTCKITGKTKVKGGKTQLNLYDSKNIIVEKDEYKAGDSITISLPDKKIKKHLKLKKGAKILLTGGKHIGHEGTLEEIKEQKIIFKSENEKFETQKRYAFVLDTQKTEKKITKKEEKKSKEKK